MSTMAMRPGRCGRRALTVAGVTMAVTAGFVAATATPAGAVTPGVHLIVADVDAFGGNGGLIDLDATTRATTEVSSGGSFADPYGVAVDNDGYLIVADRDAFPEGDGGLIRVDPSTGAQTPITSERFMVNPTGVAVETDGDIVVADADARGPDGAAGVGGVIRVDPTTGAQTLVSSGGAFANPTGIALEADGDIVVADTDAFGGKGGVIRVNPSTGTQTEVASNGAFGDPLDLDVEADGDIIVVDRDWDNGDGGVIRIPAAANALRPTVGGNEISRSDDWGNPAGIELDPDGTIYVADPDRNAVYTVNATTGAVAVLSNVAGLYANPTGLVVAPTAAPPPEPEPTGPYAPRTFDDPGDELGPCENWSYVVPPGVTELGFEVIGEPGAAGRAAGTLTGGSGGFGAVAAGAFDVTPGQTLYANVASNGTGGLSAGITGSGTGGDMSFLSNDPNSLIPMPGGGCRGELLVMAGGGGGGGGGHPETVGGDGGDAGDPVGFSGRSGGSGTPDANKPGGGGVGGLPTRGGQGGLSPGDGSRGGNGGSQVGGDGDSAGTLGEGGGGGGGFFGGGGGGNGQSAGGGGGGGGSSLIRSGITGSFSLAPTRLTAPSITLTPLRVTPTVSLVVDPTSVSVGQPVSMTATVSPRPSDTPSSRDPGWVTFRVDGSILQTAPVSAATGAASISNRVFSSPGIKTITATYEGNGFLTEASASTTVTVLRSNTGPVAEDDSATTPEDTAVTIDVLANDGDADGDPLSVSIINDPSNGAVTVDANGSVAYTPSANFNGTDSFTYQANDGVANSSVATVTITVTPDNDTIIVSDDTVTTGEDTEVTVDVLANDRDVEGDPLTVTGLTEPSNGSATLNDDGTVTYTPAADFVGIDSFTYRATDGRADSDVTTVTITVTAVNDAPGAADDSATTDEDTPVTIGITANDTDGDGDPLTVSIAIGPAHGTVAVNEDGSVTYSPSLHFNGEDRFTYTVDDGVADSNAATVTITVVAVNDAPIAVDDSYTVDEGGTLTEPAVGVIGNDIDVDAYSLVVRVVDGPTDGTLTLDPNGGFVYTPNADFNGEDSFTYIASDGLADSNVATVTITANPVNDVPVASDDSVTTGEDTPVTIAVLANDRDDDGDPLTVWLANGPSNGTVTINDDGTIVYTPGRNFIGTDSFAYAANDGAQGSSPATVTITVTAVNDPPVAADLGRSTPEDETLAIGVIAYNSDVEGDALTASIATDPSHGTVTVNPDSTIVYTPALDFTGVDSFTYTLNDGLADSDVATVTITVTPVNDAPTAVDDAATTPEDTEVTIDVVANDFDIDGDPVTLYGLFFGGFGGDVRFNPDGTVGFIPAPDFYGTATFSYVATDAAGALSNEATVTITVTPVNDAPDADDDAATTVEGTAVTIDVLANDTDVEGDPLTTQLADAPSNGTVVADADGSVVYTPNAGFVGNDTLTYTAADGTATSNPATVRIIVTAAPIPAGCTIVGTPGDDRLVGSARNDVICGLGGNDTIDAAAGNDRVLAGSGNDVVTAGPGADTVDGGQGDDRISGESGNDQLVGGLGADQLNGDSGNDDLDNVDGVNGNDRANGGSGADSCRADPTDLITNCNP